MKNNKIISEVKKAGLVATAVLTMNSCGNKQLSESQLQIAQQKADSALKMNSEYIMSLSTIDWLNLKINAYRTSNKNFVRIYVRDYVKYDMHNSVLSKFMLCMIDDKDVFLYLYNDSITNDTVSVNLLGGISNICRNEKWFNDMMLYFTDKYDERQFLNSEFFKVVNNPELRKKFERNTRHIEELQKYMEFPSQRKDIIHAEVYDRYINEEKRQR